MKNRIWAIMLCLVLVTGLFACGGESGKADKDLKQKANQTPVQTTKQAEEKTELESSEQSEKETKAEVKKQEDEKEQSLAADFYDSLDFELDYERDPEAPFVMKYPEAMADQYGPAPEFEHYPEKIIILSTSSLYLMSKLGVEPIAVSRTVASTRAAAAYADVLQVDSGKSTVDTEMIVSLEPDLVLMAAGMRDKFGQMLEELKIPVFYTNEGVTITYEQNKSETLNLAEIFGGQKALEQVSALYADLEQKAADFSQTHAEKKEAMILFGMDSSFQVSSKSHFGSILAMLPFINQTDLADPEIRMAPISMEIVIENNPEYLFLIGPPTGYAPETLQEIFLATVAENPKLWANVKAVEEGNIIALPGTITTSRGLEVVQEVNNFIELLAQKLGN